MAERSLEDICRDLSAARTAYELSCATNVAGLYGKDREAVDIEHAKRSKALNDLTREYNKAVYGNEMQNFPLGVSNFRSSEPLLFEQIFGRSLGF